jgi:putative SOS response-associated peptidase YedK
MFKREVSKYARVIASGHIVRWGLILSWAKDTAIGAKMINARAETVAVKPAFRAAM